MAPTNGGNGGGGALYVAAGAITITDCTLTGNSAIGGRGGSGSAGYPTGAAGGNGYGGAIDAAGGNVALCGCSLTSNSAIGGAGGGGYGFRKSRNGAAGRGFGGALYITNAAAASLDRQTVFSSNTASTRYDDIFGSYVIS